MSFVNFKRVLNRKGRSFVATKMFCLGTSESIIAETLEIEEKGVRSLIGKGVGFMGGYDRYPACYEYSGKDIIILMSERDKTIMIAQLDIAIASHGDKLFKKAGKKLC